MQHLFDKYLHAKNQGYPCIPSRIIHDQRICRAEFVKQIFPHMGFAQGNNILRSFDLGYFHQKVMTKFLKTSETKFYKNSET